MEDIRQEVSKVLGMRIEEGHWNEAFARLDTMGKFNQRVILELLLVILKKLDEKESI